MGVVEKNRVFFQSFNIPKCIVVGLSMVEEQNQAWEVFCKKGVLKNFANFTGKQLWWIFFLVKL